MQKGDSRGIADEGRSGTCFTVLESRDPVPARVGGCEISRSAGCQHYEAVGSLRSGRRRHNEQGER